MTRNSLKMSVGIISLISYLDLNFVRCNSFKAIFIICIILEAYIVHAVLYTVIIIVNIHAIM